MELREFSVLLLLIVYSLQTYAFPVDWIRSLSESISFETFDNHLPKTGELSKFEYSTNDKTPEKQVKSSSKSNIAVENIITLATEKKNDNFNKNNNNSKSNTSTTTSKQRASSNETKNLQQSKTLEEIVNFLKKETAGGVEIADETKSYFEEQQEQPTSTSIFIEEVFETTTKIDETTTMEETQLGSANTSRTNLDPVFEFNLTSPANDTSNRPTRQEDESRESGEEEGTSNNNNNNNNDDDEEFGSRQSDESEEDMNMLTGLISAFLGGLSRPDGSVDVEAITGLLGSLSSQNEDGTYNFDGLTELLMSFFGGGEDGGGGSDIGAFLGGLVAAFIKGVANPPGAKGAGIFTGNILNEVLPAIFAPAPTEEGSTDKPQKPLDSGGFLSGLLSTVLSGFGSMSNSSGGGQDAGKGGSKFSIFKAVFSMITSLFTASSGSKTSGW